jgi:hypothetical protein
MLNLILVLSVDFRSDILMSKRGLGEGLWCVLGNFNLVRDRNERIGLGVNLDGGRSSGMAAFDDFLNNLEFVDMPLIGKRFMWFHPNGISMSRLDRVLISQAWFDV